MDNSSKAKKTILVSRSISLCVFRRNDSNPSISYGHLRVIEESMSFFIQPTNDLAIKVVERYVSYQVSPISKLRDGDSHDIKLATLRGLAEIECRALCK